MENIGVFIKECTLLLRGNLMVELLPKKEKNNGGRVYFILIRMVVEWNIYKCNLLLIGLPQIRTTPRI